MAVEPMGARPGETVVWEGRSARGLTFNPFDGPLMAAGAMGTLIGAGLVAHGAVLTGIALVLLGAYLFVGQVLVEGHRRKRTDYVLTTDRAYLVHHWPRERTVAVDLRRCGRVGIRHHGDGTATVSLGPTPVLWWWVGPLRSEHPAFRYVRDADRLLPVIRGEADAIDAGEGDDARP